jgi:Nucleotidyl transferase AbiEii toxin, Type IV TA system
MLEFARRTPEDLERVFREAGAQRGIGAHIAEKDFWVCWLLRLIFDDAEFSGKLVFKGGTSLSKVFGIIQRFSEDIDLSVDPEWLGFGDAARLDAAPSRSQFDKRAKALQEACIAKVRDQFLPAMNRHIAAKLPSAGSTITFELDESTHSPVLLFQYPRAGHTGSLTPHVKMEFGSLYDQRPTGRHMITPLTAEVFPALFGEPSCSVVALEAERTFWEKATLLHVEYHRPKDKAFPLGMSRHYSDLAALSQHPAGRGAAVDFDLLTEVRTHKQTYFRSGWAHYDSAVPGSLHLVPSKERRAEVGRDYVRMADMFMAAAPSSFDTIMTQLEDLEKQINAAVTKHNK